MMLNELVWHAVKYSALMPKHPNPAKVANVDPKSISDTKGGARVFVTSDSCSSLIWSNTSCDLFVPRSSSCSSLSCSTAYSESSSCILEFIFFWDRLEPVGLSHALPFFVGMIFSFFYYLSDWVTTFADCS